MRVEAEAKEKEKKEYEETLAQRKQKVQISA